MFHRQRGHQSGTTSPIGVALPQYVGQNYADTAGRVLYEATGLTNNDWAIIAKDNYLELNAVSAVASQAQSGVKANSDAIANIPSDVPVSQAASQGISAAKANSIELIAVSQATVAADSATVANSIQILGIHTELDNVSQATIAADSATVANAADISTNSGLITTNIADISALNADMIPLAQKGVANGVAELGGDGKVPSSQLPAAVLGAVYYKGVYDCDTNNDYPTSPEQGDYYICNVSGTVSTQGYDIGDWMVYNGTTWDKIDNTDSVTSVNGKTGTVVLVASDVGAPTSQQMSLVRVDVDAANSAADANSIQILGIHTELDNVSQAVILADSATVANAADIQTNSNLITGNAIDISTNSGLITANAADIQTNSGLITDNTGEVSQAMSQIALIGPGGSNTHIQFNDGGEFGGVSDLAWDDSTKKMTVNGQLHVAGEISIKVHAQTTEPVLGSSTHIAVWEDTDNGNAVYLMYRKLNGDTVGVELS